MMNDLLNKLNGDQQPAGWLPLGDKPVSATPPTFTPNPVSATGTALVPAAVPSVVPAPGADAPETVAQPSNPWGFDEPTVAHLRGLGYTDDDLRRTVGGFDPSNYATFARHLYEANTTKPVVPDEKRIKNAKNIAMIGDTLALLGQMFTSSKGAHVRGSQNSVLAGIDARAENLRELYRRERARYDEGLYNAALRDMLRGMDQHAADRAGLRNAVETKQRLDQQQSQFEAKLEAEAEEREAARLRNERDFSERVRVSNANIENNRARTAIARAQEARLNSRGGQSNTASIYINANPNDPEAQADGFGGLVRAYNLTPDQIASVYNQAVSAGAFIEQHPEFSAEQDILNSVGMPTGQKKMVAHNDDMMRRIVTTYLQEEIYDKDPRFTNNVATTQGYSGYRPPWLQEVSAVEDEDDQFLEE